MKTIDLTKKLNIKGVADNKDNWFKKDNQNFYYSPSEKMISLAEQLPNKDWWILKTWKTSSILVEFK